MELINRNDVLTDMSMFATLHSSVGGLKPEATKIGDTSQKPSPPWGSAKDPVEFP